MLGLGDFAIFAVYVLCILSAVVCVVYGIIFWNRGADKEEPEVGKQWEETEKDITENLDI
jgi:hypothetical protein